MSMSKRTCSSSSRSYVQRHTRQPSDVRRHTCEAHSLCCLMPRQTRIMRAALAHNIVASTWYALTRAPCAPCAIVLNPAGSTTPASHQLHGDLCDPAVSVSTLSTARAAARIMREDMDAIGRHSRHKQTWRMLDSGRRCAIMSSSPPARKYL
jgi:hypothetical protein